eukprot:TRINITY_DN1112_c0_g1_i1.p1 TRINITY_DN1112_c0_g1~~TRINITY_DN1112_c0_g1_i1.p1  ORF type:complete len:295 (+),score=42.60 TRINITY_DN1112_c0_g1_i1:782-1666(+)
MPVVQTYQFFHFLPWLFTSVPRNFWSTDPNCIQYLDYFFKHQPSVRTYTDILDTNQIDITKSGGSGLMRMNQNSPFTVIMKYMQFLHIKPWEFKKSPKHFWEDLSTMQMLLKYAEWKLELETLDDWHRVSNENLIRLGLFHSINSCGGLTNILNKVYPDHPWNINNLNNKTKKRTEQWRLYQVVRRLFPYNTEIVEEYRHPTIKFQSGSRVTFDIYLPEYNIAFEYQGIQHYEDTKFFGDSKTRIARDNEKLKLCQSVDISLIEVPYWWDKSEAWLKQQILSIRSDLQNTIIDR